MVSFFIIQKKGRGFMKKKGFLQALTATALAAILIINAGASPTTEGTAADDIIAENGLTITPQGTMDIAYCAKDGTDEEVVLPTTVTVKTVPSDEEGYSDTIGTFTWNIPSDVFAGRTGDVYDRYTGVSLTTGGAEYVFETNGTASVHNDVTIIDVNGTQYDCGFTYTRDADIQDDHTGMTETFIIHHPTAYDGVVFQFGEATASVIDEADSCAGDHTIMEKPLALEKQFLFTASDR